MKQSDLEKYYRKRHVYREKMEKCAEGFIVCDGEIIGRLIVRRIDPEIMEECDEEYEEEYVSGNPRTYH